MTPQGDQQRYYWEEKIGVVAGIFPDASVANVHKAGSGNRGGPHREDWGRGRSSLRRLATLWARSFNFQSQRRPIKAPGPLWGGAKPSRSRGPY